MIAPSGITPTPAAFAAANPETQKRLWMSFALKAIRSTDEVYNGQIGSSFSKEPAKRQRVVEVVRDTAKGVGQEVTYIIDSEDYRKGIQGGSVTLFTDQAQYGENKVGYGKVRVDKVSKSFKVNVYQDHAMGWKQSILDGTAEKMGRNHGRNLQRDLMMTTIYTADPTCFVFAGDKTLATLTAADTFKNNDLLTGAALLPRKGGVPAYVSMDGNGNEAYGYHWITTNGTYGELKKDEAIRNQLLQAGQRDDTNELVKGGLKKLDGNTVQWYVPVVHDDCGEIGTPQAPEALLGIAIGNNVANNNLPYGVDMTTASGWNAATAGTTTTEAITGGGDLTNAGDLEVNFFRDFPGLHTLLNGVVLSTASGQTASPYWTNRDPWGYRAADPSGFDSAPFFYVLVANPKSAEVQPGRWAIIKVAVSANNGNRLTAMVERLGPSVSGIENTTVGGVTWDPENHGTYFAAGARVCLCSPAGVPIGATTAHGAGSLIRAFGAWENFLHEDPPQQGILKLSYLHNIVGHGLRRNKRFQVTGVQHVIHAVRYRDINHG